MLTEKQKIEQYGSFIDSAKFGKHTFVTLYLADVNVKNIVLTIELYMIFLKRLDEGGIPNNFSPAQLLRIKQHIVMEMITKTEIIIESLLVLLHSLSKGYENVAQTMTYYDMNLVRTILQKVGTKDFNMRKALGLPKICDLPLSKDEQKTLAEVYEITENSVWKALLQLTDFYDKFRIIYGKSKHGLTFQTGGRYDGNRETSLLEGSFVVAYDRKVLKEMPKNRVIAGRNRSTDTDWFTAVAHLTIDKHLIEEIHKTASSVRDLVSYASKTHQTFAVNCGEGYFPFTNTGKNQIQLDLLVDPSLDTSKYSGTLKSLQEKVFPEMYTPGSFDLNISAEYKSPEVLRSLETELITNVWLKANVPIPK